MQVDAFGSPGSRLDIDMIGVSQACFLLLASGAVLLYRFATHSVCRRSLFLVRGIRALDQRARWVVEAWYWVGALTI